MVDWHSVHRHGANYTLAAISLASKEHTDHTKMNGGRHIDHHVTGFARRLCLYPSSSWQYMPGLVRFKKD